MLKPLPTLVLRGYPKFSKTIDGLTFGVAAGLGFAAAQTIVLYSKVIATEPVHATSSSWLGVVLPITVLTPLLQGACSAVWCVSVLVEALQYEGKALYAVGIPLALAAGVGDYA